MHLGLQQCENKNFTRNREGGAGLSFWSLRLCSLRLSPCCPCPGKMSSVRAPSLRLLLRSQYGQGKILPLGEGRRAQKVPVCAWQGDMDTLFLFT